MLMERLEFQFSTATSEPPTGSQVRFDAATPEQTTRLWVRYLTTPGEDVYQLLTRAAPGAVLFLQDYDDHTRYVEFELTADPIDRGSYAELPVTYVASGDPSLTVQKVALYLIQPDDGVQPVPPTWPTGAPTPDEVIALVPGATTEQAQLAIDLAGWSLDAYMIGGLPDPLPSSVRFVWLMLSAQACAALVANEQTGTGPQVVSESIGQYSYRLAQAAGIGDALQVTPWMADLLAYWHPRAYDVATGAARFALPFYWFQHDLDNSAAAVVSDTPDTVPALRQARRLPA